MRFDYQRKQTDRELEQQHIARLQDVAQHRNPDSPRRLDSKSVHSTFLANTLAHPLASKDQYSGNYEQGVTQLLLVGDMVLAISRGFNKKMVGNPDLRSPVDSVRVSLLPIGDHPAATKNSSVTLLEADPSRLNQPRANGIVQPFEQITIGRDMLEAASGKRDARVSREHAVITINPDGTVKIRDISTNGTQVFSESDFNSPAAGGLDTEGREELAGLMQRLQENPHEWDKESQGITVITGV